jgi:hypothetical protein
MGDIAAEGDGLLSSGQALVVGNGVAGDCWPIHGDRGLIVGVVTSTALYR